MTDAQIALYADLRVAIPGEWRISMTAHDGLQFVYLTRPVYRMPSPRDRYFGVGDVPECVGVEKLCVAAELDLIERVPEARRYCVIEALRQIGAVGPALPDR